MEKRLAEARRQLLDKSADASKPEPSRKQIKTQKWWDKKQDRTQQQKAKKPNI